MNRPYATLDIESSDDPYDVTLDDASIGDQFALFYSVSQIECVQNSVIFDIITDSLGNSGYPAAIGDQATLTGVSQTVGGIPGSALNNVPFPIVGFTFDAASGGTLITGVRVDIGATANTTEVVSPQNANVTYRTPLSLMPAGRIRFFVMNNKVHVRYFDSNANYFAPISNVLQQY